MANQRDRLEKCDSDKTGYSCDCAICTQAAEIESLEVLPRLQRRLEIEAAKCDGPVTSELAALLVDAIAKIERLQTNLQQQIDSWPKARKDIVTLTKRESAEEIESLKVDLQSWVDNRDETTHQFGVEDGLARAVEIASKYGTDQGDDIRDAIEAEISKQDP